MRILSEALHRLTALDARLRSHERALGLAWILAWLGVAVVSVLRGTGALPGQPRILGLFVTVMGLLFIPLRKRLARDVVRIAGSLAAGSEPFTEFLTIVVGVAFVIIGLLIWLGPAPATR